ncbi:polyprenyl diphosphate synthase [Amycolatopsis coloradensis]|uniref:polyprenyl diphosphate synthase n=1 Tax=Amycolatopsis coloradensis TaxID=76021 RepID=UPI000A054661|nr:polyprenyl diphosphate synthase [Amycolatopsis coloradensis]
MGEPGKPPRHVGIIPDGNRRWAAQHGLPVLEGHRRGAETTMRALSWCEEAGVEEVTVWALSLDNIARRPNVAGMATAIAELVDRVDGHPGWDLRLIGSPGRVALPVRAPDTSKDIVDRRLLVNLAVAYDGREEIVAAAQALLTADPLGKLDATALSAELERRGQPDCDLIIRTSGELRLSGFLLWQSVHSELYFAPELWPEFTERSLHRALDSYARRDRRAGA